MTAIEKIEVYLKEHKRAVTVETLAYQFLLTTGTIGKALRELETKNKAILQYQRKPNGQRVGFWRYNREAANLVAVPDVAPSAPASVKKPAAVVRSYAHVRGYED